MYRFAACPSFLAPFGREVACAFAHSAHSSRARVRACVRGQANDSQSNADAQQHASSQATATPPQKARTDVLHEHSCSSLRHRHSWLRGRLQRLVVATPAQARIRPWLPTSLGNCLKPTRNRIETLKCFSSFLCILGHAGQLLIRSQCDITVNSEDQPPRIHSSFYLSLECFAGAATVG